MRDGLGNTELREMILSEMFRRNLVVPPTDDQVRLRSKLATRSKQRRPPLDGSSLPPSKPPMAEFIFVDEPQVLKPVKQRKVYVAKAKETTRFSTLDLGGEE